ncbi:MAG: CDP-diacylglycerol--serine O-phosphatidyltransferase [Candidatus Omnitrophica bacterium]|nr:CDP-diacylglycerol--serine O-phosphatidyltransferase [Candidatus Omnitrophota bacterium]
MNKLANFLTFLSLFCGFISLIFSLEHHFTFASWAIILSVILDGLDGQIARKNTFSSDFGKELDSLVDVVSFGIAPALLGYIFIYRDFYLWAVVALFIYLLSSVTRLAKYNITPKEKLQKFFFGFPTTASGAVLASFILIYRKKDAVALPSYVPAVFIFLVLILSYLMLCRARYLNLEGIKQLFGKKIRLFVVGGFLLLAVESYFRKAGITIFSIFLIYLIFSPFVVKRLNS